MNNAFITLNKDTIDREHICCAISDKKCKESYALKKEWLKREFENGYVFRRLDERAKVFIEYGPAEKGWAPLYADNYLLINCFWVSGKYKGKGYAKALMQSAIDDAQTAGKNGLVSIVGTKKFHFMSDTKWLLRQGFEEIQKLPSGFSLLAKKFSSKAPNPSFREGVLSQEYPKKTGVTAYYSNRCPFAEFHVTQSLRETTAKRNIPLEIIKFETMEQAQASPTPATIFSLFYNGKFVSTDISICMDNSRYWR